MDLLPGHPWKIKLALSNLLCALLPRPMRPLSASTSWSIVGTDQLCSAQEPWASPPPSPAPLLTATPPEGASARPPTSPGLASHSPTWQAEHAFETSHWTADCQRPDSSLGPWQQPTEQTLSGSLTRSVLPALPPSTQCCMAGTAFLQTSEPGWGLGLVTPSLHRR